MWCLCMCTCVVYVWHMYVCACMCVYVCVYVRACVCVCVCVCHLELLLRHGLVPFVVYPLQILMVGQIRVEGQTVVVEDTHTCEVVGS